MPRFPKGKWLHCWHCGQEWFETENMFRKVCDVCQYETTTYLHRGVYQPFTRRKK